MNVGIVTLTGSSNYGQSLHKTNGKNHLVRIVAFYAMALNLFLD